MSEAKTKVPFGVMLAATLIVLNGVIQVALAAAWASSNHWNQFPWALFRLFGSGIVGWGLMRLELWSWKWGVYGGAFYVLSGALSAASLRFLQGRGWARGGQDDVVVMMFGAMLLVIAIICLCSSQSRAAFDAREQFKLKQPTTHDDLRPPIPPPY